MKNQQSSDGFDNNGGKRSLYLNRENNPPSWNAGRGNVIKSSIGPQKAKRSRPSTKRQSGGRRKRKGMNIRPESRGGRRKEGKRHKCLTDKREKKIGTETNRRRNNCTGSQSYDSNPSFQTFSGVVKTRPESVGHVNCEGKKKRKVTRGGC